MTDIFGITLGPNVPTLVLCGHLVVAGVFFAAAASALVGGTDLLGVFLQALIGSLIVALGVVTSRVV
ncbi:MAG: hypothetical protein ABEH56_02425 [Salinirussus sp.]